MAVVSAPANRQVGFRCREHRLWRETPMKLHVGLLAAAATMLVAASYAADSDKFVIRGDVGKNRLKQSAIIIVAAESIKKTIIDEAMKQCVRVSSAIYEQYVKL